MTQRSSTCWPLLPTNMRRVVFAFALLALTAGCEEHSGADRGHSASAAAWVHTVREAHDAADDAEARGDLEAARLVLARVAEQSPPSDVATAHGRAVRQDVYFRLATVLAGQGRTGAARDAASRGLALGQGDDVLTANLFIVRGEAHEALGDTAAAGADYLAALRINEALLDTVLSVEETP